jgi:response regulator RpfG family c-di-GMP phosphodiesterase
LALIEESRGTHFDPNLVDAFLASSEEANEIRRSLADSMDEQETMESRLNQSA